jgi:hypothetical protein
VTGRDGRAGRRAPVTHSAPSAATRAKAALLEIGLELAGVRLQLFAERLFQAADASPQARADELVSSALRAIEGGALAVVAEEPELADRRLRRPALTVHEAAKNTLDALAAALLQHVGAIAGNGSDTRMTDVQRTPHREPRSLPGA